MMDRETRYTRLEEQRRVFGLQVVLFERDFGKSSYIHRGPPLENPAQLQGAEILIDRFELVRRLPHRARVVEVGVETGIFSRHIVEAAAPADLTLIDIDLGKITEENRAFLADRPEVTMIEGDSSTTLAALEGVFDWIYIDGDHRYEGVAADTEAAWPKIKAGGFLVFNDFTVWSAANMMNYGVLRCAFEFLNAHQDWKVRYLALQRTGYHDLALQRIA